MASPHSTTSHEGPANKKNLEQITFRFCSECSNMLYPKEDPDSHKLQFTCRTCQYTEEANSTCVFRNVLNNAAGETAGVTQDVGSDPTVGAPVSHFTEDVAAPTGTVICLCCGGVVMCGVCEEEVAVNFPGGLGVNISIDDIEGDDSADDSMPDTPVYLDFSNLDNDYDFMEGMEYGNDGEAEEQKVSSAAIHLPRSNKTCPVCKHEEAVFFQSQQRSAETGMKLFYVCCECGNIFQ